MDVIVDVMDVLSVSLDDVVAVMDHVGMDHVVGVSLDVVDVVLDVVVVKLDASEPPGHTETSSDSKSGCFDWR